jgi:conjugal transfer ATP-binding protein TraC
MSVVANLKKKFNRKIESLVAGGDVGGSIASGVTSSICNHFGVFGFSELLPYRAFDEENNIYLNVNTKGFVLSASIMTGASSDDHTPFYKLLQSSLPEGAILQVLMYASPKIGERLDSFSASRLGSGQLLEAMAASRAKYFCNGAHNSMLKTEDYVLRDFKMYISVVFDNSLELELGKIISIREKFVRSLSSIKMSTKNIEPDEFLKLVGELTSPDEKPYQAEKKWNYLDPLNTQVGGDVTNHKITPQRISVNDEWDISTYSVERYPSKSVRMGQMGDYIGDIFDETKRIGCPFVLSYTVMILDQSREQKAIQARAAIAKQRAKQEGAKSDAAIKEAHGWRDFLNLVEKNERVVEGIFNITLYTPNGSMEQHEASLESVFQPTSSPAWKLRKNHFLHLPALIASLPQSQSSELMKDLSKLRLSRKMWSENAANILPVIAESKGHYGKKLMVGQRRGQLFFWDPFEGPANYNVAIAGDSGSGKSVAVNEIVSSILGTNGQCFIVDIGGSYKKLCNLFGGTYLEFKGTSICLNPFSYTNFDDKEEREQFLEFVTILVVAMADPDQRSIDTLGESYITRAIQNTIATEGNDGSVQSIINYLERHDDSRAVDISVMLTPFATTGMYGDFFNGKASVDLSSSMVVFELEGVSVRLRGVIFKVLMFQVTLKMYLGKKDRQIALVLDEAWDLLSDKTGVKAADNAARRARKYAGCLITATQSFADFFSMDAARAIYNQSYWSLILMQKNTNIDDALDSKQIKLNDFEVKWLQSVKTQKGEYSEILIQGGGGEIAVGRLLLDPFSLAVYSSEATDNSKINELVSQGHSLAGAIDLVANKYRKGNV